MSDPEEQPIPIDPELEALLAGAPPEMQETVRGILHNLQPDMSPEQWDALKGVFADGLAFSQDKHFIDKKFAEMEEEMKILEESLKELGKLIERRNAAGKTDPEG